MEGNLVHLEEYVDTIVSLPHEIQRNFTLIREHDSHVQESNENLYKDIDEFMSLQNKEKDIPIEERVQLIKRIKSVFLNTLTHCEEKVSLANQCYNSVEKHLVKMEDDLKCFEEEIRLSGYDTLLEKVRIEKVRQRQLMRNKKRQEAALDDSNDEDRSEDAEVRRATTGNSNSTSVGKGTSRQRRSNRSATGGSVNRAAEKKRIASESVVNNATATSASSSIKKNKTEAFGDDEEEEEEDNNSKLSRAERLLRRTKPNFVSSVSGETPRESEAVESDEDNGTNSDNQGDDEAEDEGEEEGENEEEEEEENENENEESEEEEEQEESIEQVNEAIELKKEMKPTGPKAPISGKSDSEPLYCICKKGSFGQMVACDGRDCPIEWFHYACVGLKSLPKGKWYCKGCQEAMDAKTAAQMAIGMSTRSSRRS